MHPNRRFPTLPLLCYFFVAHLLARHFTLQPNEADLGGLAEFYLSEGSAMVAAHGKKHALSDATWQRVQKVASQVCTTFGVAFDELWGRLVKEQETC